MNIRVVRESGGIGDIVRIIPALRGLREKYPGARLWLFAPDDFRCLVDGWYDEFIPTPYEGRRGRDLPIDEARWPYLRVPLKPDTRHLTPSVSFDLDVSLFCPAFRHEADSRGEVWTDRIDLFCAAAGVDPSDKCPRVHLDPSALASADAYVETNHLRVQPRSELGSTAGPHSALIALQPFSTDPARNWPADSWRRLAALLEEAGHTVVWLDCCGRIRQFPQHKLIGLPLPFVAAFLSRCDLLIAPDSGLAHLAAAVGTPCVGLFASQSGAIMFRHYPLHTWIYPPWDAQAYCRWPCFWTRRPDCHRTALLATEQKCCPMLARITPETVAAVAAHHLRSERSEGRSVPLPPLGDSTGLPADCCIPVMFPIPARDCSMPHVALHGPLDARAAVREAFRVLRPGGSLYVTGLIGPRTAALIESEGFSRGSVAGHHFAWKKLGTYPYWSSNPIPT